jgi:hypothetical protein
MTTPVSTSSTIGQNPHSRPNSRMGAEGGSLASVNVLPQSVSSVLTGEKSRSGSSASAALPMLTSSIIQAADNHHPVALRPAALSFSKPDDSGVNNNHVHNDVECHQEQNDDDSASDEYLDDYNNAAGYETQQHTESNHIQGFNQQEQLSLSGTPAEWEDVPPDAIMAKLKTLKPDFLESKGLRPFFKSYNSWEKMTAKQRDKAVAWFRRLPSNVQGLTLTLSFIVTAANIFLILIFLFYLQLLCYNNQEWKPFRLPVSYQQQAIITQKMTLLALYIYINFLGHKCIGQITMVSFQERNWMPENQLASKQRRPMHCHAWLHSKMTMKISPPKMPWLHMFMIQ